VLNADNWNNEASRHTYATALANMDASAVNDDGLCEQLQSFVELLNTIRQIRDAWKDNYKMKFAIAFQSTRPPTLTPFDSASPPVDIKPPLIMIGAGFFAIL
jgi:hypothetical protein